MDAIKKVILIDDDEINNFICVSIMRKINFANEVIPFESAANALSVIADIMKDDESQLPDAIFLDINMPLMNGWDFLDEYQLLVPNISKKIQIFMLSSSIYQADVEKSKEYDTVVDFVTKPLKEESLNDIKNKYF